MSATLRLVVVCLAGLGVICPAPAQAYVRYLATDGTSPYHWATSCVQITGYPQGITTMTVDEVKGAMTHAVGAWSKSDPVLGACSYLDLQVALEPPVATLPEAKYDHSNNVVFRSDAWITLCSAGPNGVQVCHDPSALAITSVFARSNGEIVDADIEVNGVNFVWGDLITVPPTRQMQDLQNALTHEMGHLIGLDHTCYIFSSGGADDPAHPRPVDQNGQPIPNCSDAPPDVAATTMFASANPGDTSKRTLEADDQAAVCAVYPLAADPKSCGGGGCAVAGASRSGDAGQVLQTAGMIGAIGLASILVVWRRLLRRS